MVSGLIPGQLTSRAVLALAALAFWPVWSYMWGRIGDGSDDSWGLLALATLVVVVFGTGSQRPAPGAISSRAALSLCVWLGLYGAATWLGAARLVLATMAATTMGWLCWRWRGGSALGILGLAALSLPLLASLQFFFGYPMRALTAHATVPLLRLSGQAVEAQGAVLQLGTAQIWVDAPCSGVRMLWTGAWLAATLMCWLELRWLRALALGATALVGVLLANVSRAAAVFYLEADIILAPAWVHDGVGLVVFAALAFVLVALARWLSSTQPPQQAATLTTPRPAAHPFATLLLVSALSTCAVLPALVSSLHVTTAAAAEAPPQAWPLSYQGRPLRPLPTNPQEAPFLASFPGQVRRFQQGYHTLVVRWIAAPTRKLHPAADCYRALGYQIEPLPPQTDVQDLVWSRFLASSSHGERLLVRERIEAFADQGRWTDTSAWYWDALLGRSKGPWRAWTVAEPAPR